MTRPGIETEFTGLLANPRDATDMMWHKVILKRNTTDMIFLFFSNGFFTKAKEPILPEYLIYR